MPQEIGRVKLDAAVMGEDDACIGGAVVSYAGRGELERVVVARVALAHGCAGVVPPGVEIADWHDALAGLGSSWH